MFLTTMQTNLFRKFALLLVLCALLVSQAMPVMAHSTEKGTMATTATNAQETVNAASLLLSITYDACSGQLYVANKYGQWQRIQRGVTTTVYVNVNSSGYWYWKCGSTLEKSRSSVLPLSVNMLKVNHSTTGRTIKWYAYHN